jgi:hypothetical protein
LPALGRLVARALDHAARSGAFLDWFAFCRDLARDGEVAHP